MGHALRRRRTSVSPDGIGANGSLKHHRFSDDAPDRSRLM